MGIGSTGGKILAELGDEAFRWLASLANKLDKPADELAERMGEKLKNLEKEFPEAFSLYEPTALLEGLEQANRGEIDLAIVKPETFRKIAAQIDTADPDIAKQMQETVDQYAAEIESGIPLNNPEDSIPFLKYMVPVNDYRGSIAQFVEHDGRHRNRALEQLGGLRSLIKLDPSGALHSGFHAPKPNKGQQVMSKSEKPFDVYTENSPMQLEDEGGKKVGSSKDLFKFLSMFGALPFIPGGEGE